jgi:exodeoxyribonuclease-1
MDIYPMTVTYKLLCPEHLQWPARKDGKISFKLEDINKSNALVTEGRAHDAMTDVHMTAALAKRLAAKKEVWDLCLPFFNKEADRQQIENCVNTIKIGNDHYRYGLMISHRSQGEMVVPVLLLGQSVAYPNQTIWLKLNNDALFSGASKKSSAVLNKAKVFRKKCGEPPFFIPLNGALADKMMAADPDVLKKAFSWMEHNSDAFAAIKNHFLKFQYEKNDCDVNAKLYSTSLPLKQEEALFQEFHEANIEDKPAIAEKFPRSEHRELAVRLFGRNFPELLSTKNKKKFAQHLECVFSEDDKNVPVDHTGKRQFSVSDARSELKSLAKKELDAEQREIVKDYEQWLSGVSKNSVSFFAKPKNDSRSETKKHAPSVRVSR